MAAPSSSLPKKRSKSWLRRLLTALIGVVVVLAAAAAWLYLTARSRLPHLDGSIRVPGLTAKVGVTRDAHGVPTIEAANLHDLFFAQGYVTAQDRLWQMDILRRVAAGELAEILGPNLLDHDKEQRILGIRAAADRSFHMASPEERARLEDYAGGVNAYIESHRSSLPIEFTLLRYSPRPWTGGDSLLVAAQMVEDLNHGPYSDALVREKVLNKLGPELTADLYVNSSIHDRPPTVIRGMTSQGQDEEYTPQTPERSQAHPWVASTCCSDGVDEREMVLGSNNWVVSGAHTVTGKPMLSNDMHLGLQLPNIWYEAHLHVGDFEVAGVTLPGLPYVIVGHNRNIAWGFTNIGPTVEDVYVETFNDQGQYMTPVGWIEPQQRTEVIHVKGSEDSFLDVVITRHGPIITQLVPGETRKLALRWTLHEGLRMPFFALNSASNWDEFRHALSVFDAPGQNVVYADVNGNIGYQATGKIPIRRSGDGSLPVSGSDDAHEWVGYIPFEKLPSVYDPPNGIIATANSRITPDDYPYSISTGWASPWRTERIYSVLESGKKFSVADMLDLQNDIFSPYDRFVAQQLAEEVEHSDSAGTQVKVAGNTLRSWDGRMTADDAAPVVEYKARNELIRLLLEPKLGAAPADPEKSPGVISWKSYRWAMESIWLQNVLQLRPKQWLPSQYEDYGTLMTAAVEASLAGSGSSKYQETELWGDFNPVEIQHPILGRIPFLSRWTGPGVKRQSGSAYTVKAVTRTHGPSERMTVDLSDLDKSTLNLVLGESGNFLSPYYMDQWNAWYEGTTFELPFSAKAVHATAAHGLELEP